MNFSWHAKLLVPNVMSSWVAWRMIRIYNCAARMGHHEGLHPVSRSQREPLSQQGRCSYLGRSSLFTILTLLLSLRVDFSGPMLLPPVWSEWIQSAKIEIKAAKVAGVLPSCFCRAILLGMMHGERPGLFLAFAFLNAQVLAFHMVSLSPRHLCRTSTVSIARCSSRYLGSGYAR
jgi:hypothetical protein